MQGVTLYASETNFPNSNGCNSFRQKKFVSVLLRRRNPATSLWTGSFGCLRRPSGSSVAGGERQPPRRSATSSATRKRTFRENRTTAPKKGHPSIELPESAATPPTLGACTTCTATSSNGAGIGITRNCRAASIPTCRQARDQGTGTEPIPAYAGAARFAMMAGLAGPPPGCGSSRSGVTTTSAFASPLSSPSPTYRGGANADSLPLYKDGRRQTIDLSGYIE